MPVPLLHTTDLFHPPADPDDYYDLASVFSLAVQRCVDLRGVVIDHPPAVFPLGEPAVTSVAQLNRLAGSAVPVVTGSAAPDLPAGGGDPAANRGDLTAARFILDVLREAPEPIVITIVGSCIDVALAADLDPELFTRNCSAVYLNAGLGLPDAGTLDHEEYNTSLSPRAYGRIFDLPCPVYWLPCMAESPQLPRVGEYGTYFRFRQSEILPALSPALQSYFVFALSGQPPQHWLSYIENGVSEQALSWVGMFERNMWSTAGFLYAAGLGVTAGGEIVDFDPTTSIFCFEGADVTCDSNGVTRWSPALDASDRFIFRVTDIDAYQPAMTAALGELLRHL